MTTKTKSIPLSRSMDIPLNKLILSQANVRQVNAGVSIEDLSEDIGHRGLLTALNVRPVLDEAGVETGQYQIPAGGRRFRALEMLVKAKRLAKTAPIPCVIGDEAAGTSAEDDSLAENTHRVALHPLDQYRAFLALRRQNMSEEDIAARYFVSVGVVKQRLRLAAVSPNLLELYAQEKMSLDQLMAFSITGDHPRQEQVWEALASQQTWQRDAHSIRRMLTESTVPATDRRVVFVGMDTYEASGGEVLRDLFHADNGGWLQDALLLDRLVGEKLQTIAEGLQCQGWKWIEVLPSLPFDHLHGLRVLTSVGPAMKADDQAKIDALKEEHDDLNAEYDGWEELPDEIDQRLGEIEAEIEAMEGASEATFDPAEIGRAGVVVTLDRAGAAQIMRGYVRPEDEPVVEAEVEQGEGEGDVSSSPRQTAIITLGGVATVEGSAPDEDDGTLRPLPEKLVSELTAFRTVALRDAVASNARVALTLLLHKLVGEAFGHRYGGSCLGVGVIHPNLVSVAPKDLNDSIPARAMEDRRSGWAEQIPADNQVLWDWIDQADDFTRGELLAFCVSFGVNALMERPHAYGGYPTQGQIDRRLEDADRLAAATGLDLVADGWRATADSYLNRVPKPRILEAVREGCGERAAQLIDHLKKGDMVTEAERLLADTGWLPEVLRAATDEAAEAAPVNALPAFLQSAAVDGGESPAIAAE